MGHTKRQPHIVRLIALALCLLLVAAVLPGHAYALSGKTGDLSWSLTGGMLSISGSGAMPNYTDANMPPWYEAAEMINRIVVGDGVTSIGALSFYGCSTATRVSLPSTVTAIGNRAFKNCTSMTYISLPEGVEFIGEATFENCSSLNGIILPESLRTIGDYAFDRCTGLTSIVIPAGVTDLGMVVFYNCTGLARATIRCPIEKVPDWFFYGCTALAAVDLPKTITETGEQSFHNCNNLSTVYYSGESSEKIEDALLGDETTRHAGVSENTDTADSVITTTVTTSDEKSSTTVSVTQTVEAVITETTTTNYTYIVNGEEATVEEALTAMETEVVEVEKEKSTTITATVSGSNGWEEVADVAKDAAANRSDDSTVTVDVQVTGTTINGEAISEMAGVDARLTVSTSEGCSWFIDTATRSSTSFGRNDIDLSFVVEVMENAEKGIESETTYRVKFASDISFGTVVGIPLKVGSTRSYATLFEKNSSGLIELTSVVVDENGYAWFPVETISQQSDYFVAINEKKADTSNAVIPDSMKESYGVDHEETLTDASGTRYHVGERESRWGITGKQFTIYAVIIVAAIVLIVTGTMITINRINRSKAKYAAMAEADEEYDIDEDALRLQVMQEMLEEARRKNSGE